MDLEQIAKQARRNLLRSIHQATSGHPGGSLSCVEILTWLYCREMRPQPYDPTNPNRDRFILSKGHGCPALYSIWAELGLIDETEYLELRQLGSRLQGHPSVTHLPLVETSTGSLGQGFSVAVGMALGQQRQGNGARTYVLLGEGDLHEGIAAEAARFAGYYKLSNLIAVLDYNKWQSDKHSVLMINPVEEFIAYGWEVFVCDNGHDFGWLVVAFRQKAIRERPLLIVAHTVKGEGVSWMEDKPEFHGSLTLSDEQLEAALEEL